MSLYVAGVPPVCVVVVGFFKTKVGPEDCMTPHDTFFSVNPYFLSSPGVWLNAERVAFSLVFHLA